MHTEMKKLAFCLIACLSLSAAHAANPPCLFSELAAYAAGRGDDFVSALAERMAKHSGENLKACDVAILTGMEAGEKYKHTHSTPSTPTEIRLWNEYVVFLNKINDSILKNAGMLK